MICILSCVDDNDDDYVKVYLSRFTLSGTRPGTWTFNHYPTQSQKVLFVTACSTHLSQKFLHWKLITEGTVCSPFYSFEKAIVSSKVRNYETNHHWHHLISSGCLNYFSFKYSISPLCSIPNDFFFIIIQIRTYLWRRKTITIFQIFKLDEGCLDKYRWTRSLWTLQAWYMMWTEFRDQRTNGKGDFRSRMHLSELNLRATWWQICRQSVRRFRGIKVKGGPGGGGGRNDNKMKTSSPYVLSPANLE